MWQWEPPLLKGWLTALLFPSPSILSEVLCDLVLWLPLGLPAEAGWGRGPQYIHPALHFTVAALLLGREAMCYYSHSN